MNLESPAKQDYHGDNPPDMRPAGQTQSLLPEEVSFYNAYAWCLNPHPTVGEVIKHIRFEIGRFESVQQGWQSAEVATNIYLLGGALLNNIDEYLRGPTLRLPRRLSGNRPGRAARVIAERTRSAVRYRQLTDVWSWREHWLAAFDEFLSLALVRQVTGKDALVTPGKGLASVLSLPLPDALLEEQIAVPSPFRRLDLTHFDVLALGRLCMTRIPDRAQPILLVGLRTSGSYFVPLLRALLKSEGYTAVSLMTLQPDKGAGRHESQDLDRCARAGYLAVIVDDPPLTAGTIFLAFDIARRAGFAPDKLRALVPVQQGQRNWHKPLDDSAAISLPSDDWYLKALLGGAAVGKQLEEYFIGQGFSAAQVVSGGRASELNTQLQSASNDKRGTRLKRIFEVRLKGPDGHEETRFVLAKSVGWGWLGYHAFLAGERLAGLVPPVLGLRDGILFTEWIPQPANAQTDVMDRNKRIDTSADYIAARKDKLALGANPLLGKGQQRHHNGLRLLEKALSSAYGRVLTSTLKQPRVARNLRQMPCPFPTLIDGKMDQSEWIIGANGPLKTDFEHHGMGKAALNIIDPAYDLADTILKMALTPEEESRLIRRYAETSGDTSAEQRLIMNKLLAGLWEMESAQNEILSKSPVAGAQQELHRRFMSAWDFLTVQTARHCGQYCRTAAELRWRAPLVALDIDGVVDRRLFGFPVTTPAGIEALSLLHAHGFSIALDTARSVSEVKDYCQAYALAGGVAEHGSYLWDAVAQRGRVLISPEAMRQLHDVREQLRRLPGVFLDERHQYSIRAFTYQDKARGLLSTLARRAHSFSVGDGALAAVPTLVIQQVISSAGADLLSYHHTMIDTTINAKEANKGTGLLALRDWVLGADAETIAVGDSEPDLAMFRIASRSFAPANIDCAGKARLIGCKIANRSYQSGLLEIAHSIAHPDGQRCDHCIKSGKAAPGNGDPFLEVLQAADQSRLRNLAGAIFDPAVLRLLVR